MSFPLFLRKSQNLKKIVEYEICENRIFEKTLFKAVRPDLKNQCRVCFRLSGRFSVFCWSFVIFTSSSLKSFTPNSFRIWLRCMRLLLLMNFLPASSLSTQANNCRPLSKSVFREFGFRPAIDTSTLF